MKSKFRLSFEFEVDDDDVPFTKTKLMYLLFDAFGEFQAVRFAGREEEYVAGRYAEGVSARDRTTKIEEVKLRNRLASALKAGVHAGLTVHEVIEYDGLSCMDDAEFFEAMKDLFSADITEKGAALQHAQSLLNSRQR